MESDMSIKKNVTFNDIAKYTGFSKTTISRYFNRPESLTEEHREIIANALRELNYRENKVGRMLAKGSSECVGIIIPQSYNSYYQEMLNNILSTYDTYGYKFMVFASDEDPDKEIRYIQELMAYKMEGLIILSHAIPSERLADLPVPVVGIEREDAYISSVNCDNYMGAVQAASLLAKHNCDILIHVNTPTSKQVPGYKRMSGFQDFCEEHHLRYEILVKDMGTRQENIRLQLSALLQNLETLYPNEKKGIFFSNDSAANEFLKLLIRKYRTMPSNYRIIGFDGSQISAEAIFSISSIGQQISVTAREALDMLSSLIASFREKGVVPSPVHKVITPVLLRRETTEYYPEGEPM